MLSWTFSKLYAKIEASLLFPRLKIRNFSLFEKLLVTSAKIAARLERSSFLRNEVEQKKREWKAEMSAPKIKKELFDGVKCLSKK